MICSNCGARLPEAALFCGSCGRQVANAGPERPAVQQQGAASTGLQAAGAATSEGAPAEPGIAAGPVATPPKLGSRTLMIALVVVTLLAVGAYFVVQNRNAGWQISLKADWSSVGTGSAVRLTAQANKRVDGSAHFMTIKDLDTGAQVAVCQQGSTCIATAMRVKPTSESFVVTIGDQARSDTVPVAWRDWNLQLTTDRTQVRPGGTVTLVARANEAIDFSRYTLAIVDTASGQAIKDCGHTASCSAHLSLKTDKQASLAAQVRDGGALAASSARVAIVWTSALWAWRNPLPQGNSLRGIACPSADRCLVVGDRGTILASSDGGRSWSSQPYLAANDLSGIACPSADRCLVVERNGSILASSDGGRSWSSQPYLAANDLSGIACPSADRCLVVERNGSILASSDGGRSWSTQSSGTGNALRGIACLSADRCLAVGDGDCIAGRRVSLGSACRSQTLNVVDGSPERCQSVNHMSMLNRWPAVSPPCIAALASMPGRGSTARTSLA